MGRIRLGDWYGIRMGRYLTQFPESDSSTHSLPMAKMIFLFIYFSKMIFLKMEIRVQFLVWEDSPGEGNGNPLQYSCLENPMDRGVWWAAVHGVARVGHDWATKPPPPWYILLRKTTFRKFSRLIFYFSTVYNLEIWTQHNYIILKGDFNFGVIKVIDIMRVQSQIERN